MTQNPYMSADKIEPCSCAVLTFLNDPQILVLALDDLLEIAEVLAQIVHLSVVELESVGGALFNVEASADVDNDGRGGGETARDVEGLCEGNEDLGTYIQRLVGILFVLARTRGAGGGEGR
jgi:hypothetical protein